MHTIDQILPGGCKVGIGAKRTGFVPLDSIADAWGKDVRNLNKILVVGGRLQVEIDEISEDGERIDLRCLEIYKQVAPPAAAAAAAAAAAGDKGKGKTKKAAPAPKAKPKAKAVEEEDDDDDEDGVYSDDEDDDEEDFRLDYADDY